MVLMNRDPGAYMQLHIAATPGSGVMNHANYCAIMAMIFGAPSTQFLCAALNHALVAVPGELCGWALSIRAH